MVSSNEKLLVNKFYGEKEMSYLKKLFNKKIRKNELKQIKRTGTQR